MFFAEDRLPFVVAMIRTKDEKSRREALKKLLPMQRADFAASSKRWTASSSSSNARSPAPRIPAEARKPDG